MSPISAEVFTLFDILKLIDPIVKQAVPSQIADYLNLANNQIEEKSNGKHTNKLKGIRNKLFKKSEATKVPAKNKYDFSQKNESQTVNDSRQSTQKILKHTIKDFSEERCQSRKKAKSQARAAIGIYR